MRNVSQQCYVLSMPQQTATVDLRTRRLNRGLSLQGLADECAKHGAKVHRSTLLRLEDGTTNIPNPPLRKALAEVLDLDVTDFDKENA